MNPLKSLLLLGFLVTQLFSLFAREVDTLEFNSKILGQKLKVCVLKPIQTKKRNNQRSLSSTWGLGKLCPMAQRRPTSTNSFRRIEG